MILFDNNTVSAKEVYEQLGINKKFATWIKTNLQRAELEENKDFIPLREQSTGGRPSVDYCLKRDAAISIVVMSGGKNAKKVRNELIQLFNQRENKDLLNEQEILTLSALIGFFKFVENQKEIADKNLDIYVAQHPSKYSYAEFHTMRNKILQISKEEIEKRLIEYCTEQNKRLPALKTTRDKFLFIDMYDSLKNAVWDFLYINGAPTALKMAELAKKMARAQGISILTKNETNLFQNKEILPELKKLTNLKNPEEPTKKD